MSEEEMKEIIKKNLTTELKDIINIKRVPSYQDYSCLSLCLDINFKPCVTLTEELKACSGDNFFEIVDSLTKLAERTLFRKLQIPIIREMIKQGGTKVFFMGHKIVVDINIPENVLIMSPMTYYNCFLKQERVR